MKKNRIDIQLLLHYVVYPTTIQDFFLSAVNWLTTLNHSKHLFPNGIVYTTYTIIKKIKLKVFNCQNKHYEKNSHFEKLAAANKIAAIKTNSFNAVIVPFVLC